MAAKNEREEGGEFRVVRELNDLQFGAVRVLLRGQSSADAGAFEAAVDHHRAQGYKLESLLVELRYPLRGDAARAWTWDVRPNSDARPRDT